MKNNNNGFVYITVSIVLAMIFIMYGALMTNVTTAVTGTNSYSDGVKAYYIAQSGVAFAMEYIADHRDVVADFRPPSPWKSKIDNLFPAEKYPGDYTINWKVITNTGDTSYRFQSTGTYKSYTRTIEILVNYEIWGKFTIQEWKVVKA